MKRLIFTLICGLLASPLVAQNVKMFVVQKDGGIVVRPGKASVADAAIILGDPPPGTTGLLLHPKKSASWTNLSADKLHRKFKGKGDPVVELLPEEVGNSTSGIMPKAGNWVGYLMSQNVSGCPADLSKTLTAQMAKLDGAPVQGTIDATFNPARIAPQLSWKKTSANAWKGEQEIAKTTRIQWVVQIKSPDLIINRQQVNISGPVGGGCEVLSEVEYKRVD